ncbi:unnamed protein product [Owenia fusiformis]|uniref:Tyrosine specific protein phosphatases domain-containing protein n=1 Tax=Owenia fusiformis TaxID=6347 RepID=A0A8J1XZI8_OWEFU|nr:unnamed protein product [Owenia fusiformis]
MFTSRPIALKPLTCMMGSGASSSPMTSPEPTEDSSQPNQQISTITPSSRKNSVMTTKNMPLGTDRRTLTRTNEVAPIIIKVGKEEFQRFTEFKDPIVYGRIADNMPEHPLVKNKYFLVKDFHPGMDKLGTMETYQAPNVRKAQGSFPVYGMGQPTKDSLSNMLELLHSGGHSEILVLNLREEPVLFLKDGFDMVTYSPRHQDHLHKCEVNQGKTVAEASAFEVAIRKEIMDLAGLRDEHDSLFQFYNDITNLTHDPQLYYVAYEDFISISDEVYQRHTFFSDKVRLQRLCFPTDGAPSEEDFDTLVSFFKACPALFDGEDVSLPAMLFTSHTGEGRATVGMVIGYLVLSHMQGFPNDAIKTPYPINEKSPNYERGEFTAIVELIKYLSNGPKIKQEVDVTIDMCGELNNLIDELHKAKETLEEIETDYIIQGESAMSYFREKCVNYLERYFYLICFNAYLHDQFVKLLSISFSQWMKQHPYIYHLFSNLDISCRTISSELLLNNQHFLVADDYWGLDVLSSQMDVKVSNFRRIPSLPVYGSAQPSREGLSCVMKYLTSKKLGHPKVVLVNLREDMVLECDAQTFSPRDINNLEEPVIMPDISGSEIEAKENEMKNVVKPKKSFQIYTDLSESSDSVEFSSVLTPLEMFNQQCIQTPQLVYHRIPISDDAAPKEKNFDQIMALLNNIEEIYTDEDGPALLFHCRTGKGRTTTAMAIAGLIICHKKGFPYGTKPGEQELVSCPNATYTKGEFLIVQRLVRMIPNGQQMKREVDFMLDQCSETMTPMHYHVREVIFVTYNKMKKAKTDEDREELKLKSLQYLERYLYLILFNTYLHAERRNHYERSFTRWMKEVGSRAGVYEVLDDIAFTDFESVNSKMLRTRRARWKQVPKLPFRGKFI